MSKGKKENPLWKKQKPEIDLMLKELGSKPGVNRHDIADALNKKGLKTYSGCKWTHATVCSYGLKEGLIRRLVTTVAGASGSTGNTYSSGASPSLNGRRPNRRARTKNNGLSNADVEEIFTSNLRTDLKMRVIRIVAMSGD